MQQKAHVYRFSLMVGMASLGFAPPAPSYAQAPAPDLGLLRFQEEQERQSDAPTPPVVANDQKSDDTLSLNADELLQNPPLLAQAMRAVARQAHLAGIQKVLPIYLQWEGRDPILVDYATGLLAFGEGRFTQAAQAFRKALDQDPSLDPVRLRYAAALLYDNQIHDAKIQLQRLENTPDPALLAQARAYQNALKERQKWQLNATASILKDENINQAPDQTQWGNFRFHEKIADTGLHYHLDASKPVFLPKGFFAQPRFSVWGKAYKNESAYNDTVASLETTFGFGKARYRLAATPYLQKRFYGNDPYSDAKGLRLTAARHLNERLSVQLNTSHHRERMRQSARQIYNNNNNNFGASVVFRPRAQTSVTLGAQHGKRYGTRDLDDRYRSVRYYAAIGQQWSDIGGHIRFAQDNKRYLAPNLFSGNENRRDTDRVIEAALWHNRLQYKGFRPKLVWQRQQTRSNSPFNAYTKQGLYIEIDRVF